jgi:hypothetical protein
MRSTAGDHMSRRDPCAAIRPEDDDLLRALGGAAPSKLLLTTRLTPKVLLNASGQAVPGVVREALPGLRPADAEALFRACGATGDSQAIQQYLQTHCDCHPLVTGALAGLVAHYHPARGNFDAWAADPEGGTQAEPRGAGPGPSAQPWRPYLLRPGSCFPYWRSSPTRSIIRRSKP